DPRLVKHRDHLAGGADLDQSLIGDNENLIRVQTWYVKSPMAISIEIQRSLVALLKKAEAEKRPFEPKIVIAPQVMQRLRTEDSEILAQLQRDFDTRLTFVSELHRHPEAFAILDAATSKVLYSQS
ncbi:MAG: hypothetical protein IJQ65_09140, partial [Kiritimatiellae bacterium]|nr:hypothetical protein [Kiritimatiellia bacterium]